MFVSLLPMLLAAQPTESLPFAAGERLTYVAKAGPGLNGSGEMWVDGPVDMRGVQVITLHSEMRGGFGFLKVSDRASSSFDVARMASMHYSKVERYPIGKHAEEVEIDPATRSWRATDGRSGTSLTDQPLDELSFVYALRSMTLPADSALVLNRHFDASRNPTIVRSLGRGSVTTPAGTFTTEEVEMRVRDPRRYKGEGVIHFSFSADACRRPVRIESAIPNAGTVVLTLSAAAPVIAACAPH
ncbi:MAG: DUF3108 domain-containing protein [Gemmatimonadaceae bacterium]